MKEALMHPPAEEWNENKDIKTDADELEKRLEGTAYLRQFQAMRKSIFFQQGDEQEKEKQLQGLMNKMEDNLKKLEEVEKKAA